MLNLISPKSGGQRPKAGFAGVVDGGGAPGLALNRCLVIMAVLAVLFASGAAQGAADVFAPGQAAWAAKHYEAAAEFFGGELKQKPSAEAWRNFGEAAWQGGHPGAAVLAWERARWLNPYDTNAAACLRFAEGQGLYSPMPLTWTETFSTWLPANGWAGLSCVSLWLAVGLLVVPAVFRWRKTGWLPVLAAVAAGIFLLTLPALAGIHTRMRLGVVPLANTPLRQTPTATAQILSHFAAGDMVRCLAVRGEYYLVRTANDATGWVAREDFQWVAGNAVPGWAAAGTRMAN